MKMPNTNPDELNYVPFDLETTGLTADSIVTTTTIKTGDTYTVFTPTEDTPNEEEVEEITGENVSIVSVDSQKDMLEAISNVVNSMGEKTVYTAFHGETYHSGFDLPMLRTIAERFEMAHPFKGELYFDAMEPIKKSRLNTTVVSTQGFNKTEYKKFTKMHDIPVDGTYVDDYEEALEENEITDEMVEEWAIEYNDGELPTKDMGDLVGVYNALPGAEEITYDNGDSQGVVEAWEDGDVLTVILHNIADVVRTDAILEAEIRQVAPKEMQPKRL